jgi:ATP-dependent Lon protease
MEEIKETRDFSNPYINNNSLPIIVLTNSIIFPRPDEFRLDITKSEEFLAIEESEREFNSELLLVVPINGSNTEFEPIALRVRCVFKISASPTSYKARFKTFERVKLGEIVFSKKFRIYHYEEAFAPFEDRDELDITMGLLNKAIEGNEEIVRYYRDKSDALNIAKSNYSYFTDFIGDTLPDITYNQKKQLFVEVSVLKRMILIMQIINKRSFVKDIESKITNEVNKSINGAQREYYLREKIKAIQNELGDKVKKDEEADELRELINAKDMPQAIKDKALNELKKYIASSSMSPDSNVSRNYLDLIVDLPWNTYSQDESDLKKVQQILDEDHFGLDKVKERILEFLSVAIKTKKNPKMILCLYGPPGVGKTSLGMSIARALNKKFVKTSLGGIRDEAEIRGHRRTYVGALPGRILKGLKDAGTSNPVFLIDEIDKLTQDRQGDPASAMLEVFDPEQNFAFIDNYLEEPYDLSKVFFLATANYIENIPEALRDRIELIELNSYTEYEKFQIAKLHLIPKLLKDNSLNEDELTITDDVIFELIRKYTREAGVRELSRNIESLIRKGIKEMLLNDSKAVYIDSSKLESYLGREKYSYNEQDHVDQVGVVNGLAYTAFGGDTLCIEVAMYPGNGQVVLTGKLGDVMKESAQTALSYVRSNATLYNIDPKLFTENNFHVHVPEGAVPKDGPSAGVTIATAILSALTHTKVNSNFGMTGEITLRGKVLPIGGLREKSIAALRSGLKQIFIPKDNEKDIVDIPEEVREKLAIVSVSSVSEIFETVFVK